MSAWQPGKSALNLYRTDLREALGRSGKTLAAMRCACNTYGAGVLESPDDRTWVWSDLHLGHGNIIDYQRRPFDGLGQMNEALWAAWHSTVGPDDTLVCVGDFAMASALCEATWARVRGAPGRSKILVVGNHDLSGQGRLRGRGVSPHQGVADFPRRSAADLHPRAVADRPGRARQRARPPAQYAADCRHPAYQRVGGAA